MSRGSNDAYSAACRAAHEIVESCIAEIVRGIADGEITSDDDLIEFMDQVVDNALTYTVSAYVCVWGLRDSTDAIEEGLSEPSNFTESLQAQAYVNLRDAIQEYGASDFEHAFKVASDEAEEKGEV